jgi:predicted RNA binding protein YcfA (HicA-like mRNA interferase family)
MTGAPTLEPRETVAILNATGFVEVCQRGSHKQFRHPDGRSMTVPVHGGRHIVPILLRHIRRDVNMKLDKFPAFRK